MKKSYLSPAVIDYGSIADCTFVTPAASLKTGLPVTEMPKISDGNYVCRLDAGTLGNGSGGKNYLILQCDKYGEYSHS